MIDWFKAVLIELCAVWRLRDLHRAMAIREDRPLRSFPDWLVGWIIMASHRADPSPTWARVFSRVEWNRLYGEAAVEYRKRKEIDRATTK